MNLERVQDPQRNLRGTEEIREVSQGVVEAPLEHKDNEVLIGHVLSFKDGDLWLLRARMCCSRSVVSPPPIKKL